MEKIPLSVLVSKLGQKKVADLFGIQQSAINKALKNKRNIFVIHVDGEVVGAEEIKVFPNKPERETHVPNQHADA
ncbi:Cro/Cl family transcriptional regulator [Proteus vulgaris]|nr:Cro/Cl family transcriptional regulator [Proteus vulgaris]